jgi:hypothetical protein
MKLKLIFGFALACASSMTAFGGQNYGMAGCGLGSLIIPKKGPQVTAATTNNTGTQSFGITSGTSNCVPSKQKLALNQQRHFIKTNLASVAKESSQGSGETLQAYSETLGCSSDSFGDFAELMQGDYRELFSKPGALAVLDATKEKLRVHPVLSQKCNKLI